MKGRYLSRMREKDVCACVCSKVIGLSIALEGAIDLILLGCVNHEEFLGT